MGDRFDSVFRPGLFDGQVILVTGGGSGIGRCTAHELAALGATVVVGGRRRERLEAVCDEIRGSGGKGDLVEINIRDEAVVDAAVKDVVSRHGRIDGLFNNAGGQFVAPVESMSPKGWRTVIDLNLNGTFLVSCAVFHHSMKENGGAIVNMLADIWTGYPHMSHMSAARAGIENLSQTLCMEWGANGIRINCVAPGTILSSGMLNYDEDMQNTTVRDGGKSPAGRLGTESEVSAAVTFLLSPASAYITGATVRIDGGACFHKGRLGQIGEHDASKPWNGFHLRPNLAGTPFEKLG